MNRDYVKILASMGISVIGLVLLVTVLCGSALGDVDLVIETDDIIFTVDGQEDNTPTENDLVVITATIWNLGNDTNATDFDVDFYDGAGLLDSVLVSDNVSFGGGHINVSINWTATGPGNHTINVTVDDGGGTGDSNLTNNTALKNLTVNIAPTVNIMVNTLTDLTLNNFQFNASGSNDPDGNIVSYFWAFGDGGFAASNISTHAYSDDGIYTVTLLITDNDGGTNSTTVQVTVNNRPPVARATDRSALTYKVIVFDSSNSTDADGTIKNVTWKFLHDSSFKYGKKVLYTYTNDGVYQVNMTVTDDDGATDSHIVFITIKNRAPLANIIANRTKINTTENITFNGDGSSDMDGSILNYTWIFPDAINRYGPQVSYQFNMENGSYQVTLVVTDDDGAIGFTNINIKVGNKAPIADPGLDTVADTYEIITFDGSASYDPDGAIVNYTWDMGDGRKRYNASFNYFYTDDGSYIVRLTVIDDEGASNSTTLTTNVMNQAPWAYRSPITTRTYTPVNFNTSECTDIDGYVNSVQWVFQDPIGFTTVNGNTSYQWNVNGTYLVEMTITDDDGAVAFYSFNVTVLNSNPWAMFSYTPSTSISVGDEITFDASASVDLDGSIVNWLWYFGESPQSTGNGEIVHYIYATSGYFQVELVVIDNSGGSNSSIKTIYVAPKNDPPSISFEITAAEMLTNRTINFDASASSDPDGDIVKYTWDFGDGSRDAHGMVLTHKYHYPGTYNVSLIIEDNGGKTNTSSQEITLAQAPNLMPLAVIEGGGIEVTVGDSFILDGRGSYDQDGYIVNYTWDFSDGTYKYASYISKTYSSSDVGTKTVTLTVTDNQGGADAEQTTITVLAQPKKNVPPTAQFSFSPPEPITTGEDVRFDASSSTDSDGTIAGYTWLFGDGTFAEGKTAIHKYTDNRVYLVVLTVIDNSGGSGTISKEITISNKEPVAVATASKDTANTFESLTFDAGGSHDDDGIIKSYTWMFGTGNDKVTKTGKVVTHSFTKSGDIKVTLKVLDDDGAISSTEISMKINNRAPIAKTGSDVTILEEQVFEFDASASKDLDGSITDYYWDFGDGTGSHRGAMIEAHSFPKITGDVDSVRYPGKLYVTDNNGAQSEEFTFNVTVLKKQKPPKDDPDTPGFIPGFEALVLVASMAVAVTAVAFRNRRRQ